MYKHHGVIAGLALLALLSTALALPVFAAQFHAGETYTLEEGDELDENVYAAGESISILGNARRDAVVAGADVRIAGDVGVDVLAAGGSIDLLGDVADDVRAAGGTVALGGTVAGDAVIAGGTIELLPGSRVQGDALIAGGRIIMQGTIEGDARVFGGTIELNGVVGGTTTVRVGDSLVVGDGAGLAGSLVYDAPKEALISEQARIDGAIDARVRGDEARDSMLGRAALSFLGLFFIIKFLAFLVASVVFVMLFRRFSERVVTFALGRGAESVGVGFAVWVATPVAALLAALTIVGFLFALLIGFGYLAILTLAKILTAVMAGAILSLWLKKTALITPGWTALGALALELVRFVPILGWLVNLLLLFAMLGSLARGMYEHWWRDRDGQAGAAAHEADVVEAEAGEEAPAETHGRSSDVV